MINRLLIFFVAMLPLFTLTACGDDDEDGNNLSLVGSWVISEGSYYVMYTFEEDATGSVTIKTPEQDCKATFDWHTDVSYIYMSNARAVYGFTPEDFNEDGTVMISDGGKARYSLDDDTLWLGVDGDLLPFTRM